MEEELIEKEEEQFPPAPQGTQTLEESQQISPEDRRHPNYFNHDEAYQQNLNDLDTVNPAGAYSGIPDTSTVSAEGGQPNVFSETGAAIVGGAADAAESVGGFLDLTGDTLKAGFGQLFGSPVQATENPFSKDYQSGTWLDIPDDWVPENKTALGKLARGFVEFGILTAATGSVGGAAFGGARLGTRGLVMARSAGVGARGTRYIKFLGKTSKIAAEGGVADLVSSASEDANMANLVNEFAPWMPFSQALAVDPDDNPWLSRIKTVTAGAGVNLVGWRIASFAKGRWAAKKAYKAGKTIDEANDIGNQVDADEYIRLANESETASTNTAAEAFAEGRGISHSDPRTEFIYKNLDPQEADRYARIRAGETLYDDAIEETLGKGTDFVTTDAIAGGKPRAGQSNPITWANDFDKAAWEVRAGKTLKSTHKKILETLQAQGFDVNAVRAHGAKIHDNIKGQVKEATGSGAFGAKTRGIDIDVPEQGFEGSITRRTKIDSAAERQRLEDIADARGAEKGDVFDPQTGQAPSQAADNVRQSHPKVNPGNHLDVEKADIVTSDAKSIIRTSIKELKNGGSGRSWKHMWTSYSLKKMTGGNARRLSLLEQTRDELVEAAFKGKDNTMSYNDLLELTDHHIAEGLDIIMDGNDIANRFKKLLTEDPHNYRVFMTDGVEIKTITPAQKAAVQLNMAMLADTATAIAQGAVEMVDEVPITTQFEQVMDAMKALLVEHKRFGVMWGLDGVAQQLDQIPENLARQAKQRIAQINTDADEYFDAVGSLAKEGKVKEMKALMEIHAISGNKINTLEQVHDFINASMGWGRSTVHGVDIRGMKEQQLLSTWYNSILSSLKTPIKAITGTNMISLMRPFQAYLGAFARGDQREMVVAMSMIDSIRKGWAESLDMFKYNWDAGVHKKAQTYDIRYDLGEDLAQWKAIGNTIDEVGTESQKRSYAVLNGLVDFNTSRYVRYSTNAMGAGDAFARTIVGRMEMRHRAIRKAIDDGVDIHDARKVAQATEENFRKEIFKEGKDGKWVVHDKAATMAGDEAAMTRNLDGVARIFDDLNQVPILRAFFPFARTGINALNLSLEHVPGLARTQRHFRDVLSGDPERLAKWGIRPEDAGQARALLEGRLATGKALMGMTALTALTGNMTGDYPYDKERRDLWRLNKIPPYSIKIGDTWVSYRNIEPFNTVAAMAANLVTNADVLGENLTDEWYSKIGFMFSAVFVDKTMLSGVKELFAVADFENAGNRGKMVTRTLASKIRPVIPFASLSKDIGNILDPINREADSLLAQILQKDILMKKALLPKYDILSTDRSGKAFSMNHAEFQGSKGVLNPLLRIFNAVSPVSIVAADKINNKGNIEVDEVKETLNQMRYNLPEIMQSYKGVRLNARQRSRLQYYLSIGDLRRDLERVILPKNSTVRTGLEEYRQNGFRESEGYKLSDQDWYKKVHNQFLSAIDIAMAQVMAEDSALRREVLIRAKRKTASQEGNTERMKYYQNLDNLVPTR